MKFDIFFSICQAKIDGVMPSERKMFDNFFDQVTLADSLGFDTAWIAESHLSSEVQKKNLRPVIPNFSGEVGLNTDILQLAYGVYSRTKRITVGSAIKNILCNGGPLAQAEAIKTFLSLKKHSSHQDRRIKLGFASGRFEYSNRPFGIRPRNELEQAVWSILKGKIFQEATEVFLKSLRGDVFSSKDIRAKKITSNDFREDKKWEAVKETYKHELCDDFSQEYFAFQPFWEFETLKIIPQEPNLDDIDFYLGSHDPSTQVLANSVLPCRVFNLSITPSKTIKETHQRMSALYEQKGLSWHREYMPRTVLVFVDNDPLLSDHQRNKRAKEYASKVLSQYWKALVGTLDTKKIQQAVDNALYGCPKQVAMQLKERFHPKDCLMLWFDFYCHDNKQVKNSMKTFVEEVVPLV